MLDPDKLEKLNQLAGQVAEQEGCYLYDVEFVGQGRSRVLRVFIDRPGQQQAVSVDDCAKVSRGLNLLLDVENVVEDGPYHLEVSSPGVERRLRRHWHFSQAVGHPIFVKLRQSTMTGDGKKPLRKFNGTLLNFDGKKMRVKLKGEDHDVEILLDDIEKAHMVFEFEEHSMRTKR